MFGAYRNLLPQTRIKLGVGLMLWASAGLYFLDSTEKKLGLAPAEKDKQELRSWLPRIWTVDRDESK
ncbi:putative fatty acid activator Faa4 [Ophiocordyceps camponoti-floridani]|uniref:Putative fatty acid activator Faa4 n=1 Tax=Ophiocordyceps camponoti-floridani TaxID=2030778 RepID=A0A8H4Q6H6_9HYPO|nr:putative fatty acid activator Faa4 [Ophiocordyceps camponoti-floridani]